MSKITISKGVVEEYIEALLNRVQSAIQGETLTITELEGMQEKLWRIEHYINQGESK